MNLDEYRKIRQPQSATHPRIDVLTELKAIAQEFVRLDALTGDPDWDYFLRYIEAALKAAHKHREFEQQVLNDPLKIDQAEMLKAKAKIGVITGRIEALEEILKLPKMLKEGGEAARKKIAEMERDAA